MSRLGLARVSSLVLGTLSVSALFFACSNSGSSSGDGDTNSTGGVIDTGGASSSGGSSGSSSGGTSGSGGASGAGASGGSGGSGGASGSGGGSAGGGTDAGSPDAGSTSLYVCESRSPQDPGGAGAASTACCGGMGTCTAPSGADIAAYGHDTCDKSLLCEPTAAAFSGSAFATCTSKVLTSDPNGLEGRCVPKCFALGIATLPTMDDGGTCGSGELCVPCYAPVDATPTGACSMKSGDAPAAPAPAAYATCPKGVDGGEPNGGGSCVPETALTKLTDSTNAYYNPSITGLKQDNCATGEKCVPTKKVADPGYCFPKCTTSTVTVTIGGGGADYMFGACSPAYVVFDVAGSSGVTVSTGGGPCAAGSLCAPCKNPLAQGAPSGSCY